MPGRSRLPVLVFDADPWAVEDFRIILDPSHRGGDDLRAIGSAFEAELHRELAGAGDFPEVELTAENDGGAAIAAVHRAIERGQPFRAAFIDVGTPPGHWGLDVAETVRALDPELPIVLTAARCDLKPVNLCKRIPPADRLSLLSKPIHPGEMRQLILAADARRAGDRAHALARRMRRDDLDDVLSKLAIALIVVDGDGRIAVATGAVSGFFPRVAGQLAPGTRVPGDLHRLIGETASEAICEASHVSSLARETRLDDGRWILVLPARAGSGAKAYLFMDISERRRAEDSRRGIGRQQQNRADV